jgi:hypothetical protein
VIWVFVFGGIALAGLVMLIAYAIWLAHKASDVFAELKVLGRRGGQFADIVSQIKIDQLSGDELQIARPDSTPRSKQKKPTLMQRVTRR